METLITLLSFFLIWLPFILGALFLLVVLVIYALKSTDYESDYLKSLSDDERLLYLKHKTNIRMPLRNVFVRKEVDHNENK